MKIFLLKHRFLLSIVISFLLCCNSLFANATLEEVNKKRMERYYEEVSKQNQGVESLDTFVQNVEEKDYLLFNPKSPTPTKLFLADLSIPFKFSKSNNLAKKPGSFFRAFGEVIFVQGTISDSFGVPITDAKVKIWQKNAAGKYHSLLDVKSEYIDRYFSMSGTSVSDNLGNYNFITIMPGGSPGRAPHINMIITHRKFGKLHTELYFEDHPFNKTDYQYLSYDKDEQKALTASVKHSEILNTKSIKVVNFDITMDGVHQFKGF